MAEVLWCTFPLLRPSFEIILSLRSSWICPSLKAQSCKDARRSATPFSKHPRQLLQKISGYHAFGGFDLATCRMRLCLLTQESWPESLACGQPSVVGRDDFFPV